ncbi:MAG: hypothetical protein DHS20C16_18450 [Phycisphaerae bacterium]|nr:MAG: hypothetical protein DHS20C16_18450 [Phycisphaerae bacterium]
MHPFEQTVSVIGPIVGAIVVLTLFFKFLGLANRGTASRTTRIAVKGVFDGSTLSTVHLSSGNALEDVRILGFTDPSTSKVAFPHELGRMVILQHSDGRHTLIQAKMIRKIDVQLQTK